MDAVQCALSRATPMVSYEPAYLAQFSPSAQRIKKTYDGPERGRSQDGNPLHSISEERHRDCGARSTSWSPSGHQVTRYKL